MLAAVQDQATRLRHDGYPNTAVMIETIRLDVLRQLDPDPSPTSETES